MPTMFKSGELVLLRTKTGRKESWELATFHAMQTRSRVVVSVEGKLDGEVTRLVDLRSIKPYYDHPTDQQRRARHVARSFKMGVRIFRLEKPDGKPFSVQTIDVGTGRAFGRVFKRKTLQIVPLHSLWPNLIVKFK